MACEYSPGIVDLIEERWAGYNYTREGVTEMVALISRPSSSKNGPVTDEERIEAEALIAAGLE